MKNLPDTQHRAKTGAPNMKAAVFGEGGMLHQAVGDKYELRDGQMRMAVAISKAIMARHHLLCEGATGIGKSFGYLIPAFSPATRRMRAAVEGEGKPVILSTSTKILQDQLIETDVPLIRTATGVDLNVHVAKGRNNYLSWRRLDNLRTQIADNSYLFDNNDAAQHSYIQSEALAEWWAAISENNHAIDGEFVNFTSDTYNQVLKTAVDLEVTNTYPLHKEVISAVRSDHHDCLGKACSNYDGICPYFTKRRQMGNADLIIANHTLLAHHLKQGILPDANTFIIDEAHKFYAAVSSVFQIELSLQRVRMFFKMFLNLWHTFRKEAVTVDRKLITAEIQRFTKQFRRTESIAVDFFEDTHLMLHRKALDEGKINTRTEEYPYAILAPFNKKSKAFLVEIQKYVDGCNAFVEKHFAKASLDANVADIETDNTDLRHDWNLFSLIRKQVLDITNDAAAVLNHTSPKTHCYWADITAMFSAKVIDGTRVKLVRTPIDITTYLEPLFEPENSVILTSATLTTGHQSFDRLKSQLGLHHYQNVKEIVEPSPFPLKSNAEIHLFSELLLPPKPSDTQQKEDAYLAQQAALCEYYLNLHHGRALILCTSRYFMDTLYEQMTPVLNALDVNGYIQTPNVNVKQLLSHFVSDESSVLFGVDSCWEGLDAPGDTLKTVLVTKLPFAPPHPVIDARIKQLNDARQGFWQVQLPEMLLRLKQGAGRLIRSATDTGVIAILDPRAMTKSYSRDILDSLPKARIVRNPSQVMRVLDNT